ncbi:MAG: response regulator transcription factor [Actinobacteria bacterium]|nr:response regulator transcription factor [Actinomycetota bacterium]
MSPVRVVVVDDHEIVRSGVAGMLARVSDFDVVGTAATGEEGLNLILELQPDVAVVDYSLPRMSGVEVCEQVAFRAPKTGVVVLTGFVHDEVVLRSIEAGARAYLCKDVEGHDLKKAIRVVAEGGSVLDPRITSRVMQWAHRRNSGYGDTSLSIRETEVLRLVARGETNAQIAASLNLSENTVKTYLRRALEKLSCHTRSQGAAVAAQRGLL